MLPRKMLKNSVSLMPFPAFWCGFLCMEQVTNENAVERREWKLRHVHVIFNFKLSCMKASNKFSLNFCIIVCADKTLKS